MRTLFILLALVLTMYTSRANDSGSVDSVRICGAVGCSYVNTSIPQVTWPTGKESKRTLSMAGYPSELIQLVKELEQFCGSRLISAHRPGARVRGSGHPSLHAVKRAVDMAGNPSCMYARLKGWPGGVSTDYARVQHIHISYAPSGMEWGSRFAHWQPRATKKRGFGG
jgi:hypothetical protein